MGVVLIAGPEGAHVRALRESALLAAHQLSRCSGSLEAVRFARSRPVDVLLTDPAAPIEEDLVLVEEIKAIRSDVRIIVLAPALTDADVIKALRAHVFACFTEPFDQVEIAEMTRSAVEASDWKDGIEVLSALPNWLSLRVACRLLTVDRLTRFMTEWRGDLPSAERDLLMTAFRELLLNAMEHGAGFDPGKTIQVTAARTARAIVFHFRDPGNGFDPADLLHAAQTSAPDHVVATTLHRAETGLRPGGFGMLIVRGVVDELIYNEHGNEVLMIKHTI
jgi:anti-sigma regulatory factor (Ser/Thr protein kinase)/CheY-like chemotaxis protein